MNGLDVIDEKVSPKFIASLLGQRPKENAFIEIHNMVASLPIYHISREQVSECLSRYKLNLESGKSRLLNIYSQVLEYFIRDMSISDDESNQLKHLSSIFDLNQAEISQVHAALILPIYESVLLNALADHRITDEESQRLDDICAKLRIPDSASKEIRKRHSVPIFQQAVKDKLADDLFSPEEEQELADLAKSLRLSIRWEGNSDETLRRARYLWYISQGHIPAIQVSLHLQPNEYCIAKEAAEYYEPGKVTSGVAYGGFSSSYNLWGVRFKSGIVKTHRLSYETMVSKAKGTLYVTNRRFIFIGSFKNISINLTKIINVTFYADGLRIEKDTGKPQVFTFAGDLDMLRMAIDYLIPVSHEKPAPKPTSSRPKSPNNKSRTSQDATNKSTSTKTAYEILQIRYGATLEEIKIAYRTLAIKYHPDKVANMAIEFQELAELKMKEINLAYESLKNSAN